MWPEEVNDDIPSEAEIRVSVRGLKCGRSGVPLDMRAEELKGWLREAKRKKVTLRIRWDLVVRLVQLYFGGGTMPEYISWSIMFLLP